MSLKERINALDKQGPEPQRLVYEKYGIISNPFPSAAQTSGHPRMPTDADGNINNEIEQFYKDEKRKSHVIVITASQGVGKTNILNEYERQLREAFESRGFFIIRYIADPEPSFDPLIRIIFDALGEDHLKKIANLLAKKSDDDVKCLFQNLRSVDMRSMLSSLREAAADQSKLDKYTEYALKWLSGLPVIKEYRENLKIRFRLDSVESKTQALRDLVIASSLSKTLQGIFLLLDEMEKWGSLISGAKLIRYLSALRALIDALPENLFLMIALAPDALERYKEILPALRGRLKNEAELKPLMNLGDAIKLYKFYLDKAKELADIEAKEKSWTGGDYPIVSNEKAERIFQSFKRIPVQGVRQRDFLNELHQEAQNMINVITQQKSNL